MDDLKNLKEELRDLKEAASERSLAWELIKNNTNSSNKKDFRQTVTIWILIGLLLVNLFVVYKLLDGYKKSVEGITSQYLEYLSEYDFSGTIEATQDGVGPNIVGGGNITYGSNSSNN